MYVSFVLIVFLSITSCFSGSRSGDRILSSSIVDSGKKEMTLNKQRQLNDMNTDSLDSILSKCYECIRDRNTKGRQKLHIINLSNWILKS